MGGLIETAAVSRSGAGVHTQEASCADSALPANSLVSLDTTSRAAVDNACELDQPEYKTDDFRLNSFKIAPCTNEQPHDWCLCPFAHPGEKAVRRDPRLYKYTGTSCPDYRKGSCKRGSGCPYAHGVFEVWLHPSRYRTQMCKDAPNCSRQVCFFAHSEEELRHVEPEEPLALEEVSDSASGCSGLSRSNSGSTLSNDTMEQTNTNWPKCGPNTNVKAAAAAKAKAAAATSASDKAPSSSSSAESNTKSDKSSRRASLLSRSSNSSSPAAVGTARLAGISLSSLHSSYSSNSMVSLLSQATLGSNPTSSFGSQDWGLSSMLASAGPVPSLALGLPSDLGVNPTASCSACASSSLGLLCDTFGSLDLAASAAGARALAGQPLAGQLAGGISSNLSNPWAGYPAGSAASAPAGVSANCLSPSELSAVSLGLPSQPLQLSSNLSNLAGQHNAAAASKLALAAVAQQEASKQHHQQQQMQELMAAILLQQQQLQQHQQQHRQAMWNAAFTAAAGVGLGDVAAAACADAAVENTTAVSSPARLQADQLIPASGGLEVAGLQESQLLLQGASLLQRQQQQQQVEDLQSLLRGGLLAGLGGLGGMEAFVGQSQLQRPITAAAGRSSGGFLQ